MTKAVIVANDQGVIGIAVPERRGFLFFSADPHYRSIEAKSFRSFKELERAAAAIDRPPSKRH